MHRELPLNLIKSTLGHWDIALVLLVAPLIALTQTPTARAASKTAPRGSVCKRRKKRRIM